MKQHLQQVYKKSRPILTGVHFVLSDNKELKTVATDSHRMSQKSDYTGEKWRQL